MAHLTNNAGKWQLAQEKLRGLLKVPNLPQCTHTGASAAFPYGTPCLTRQRELKSREQVQAACAAKKRSATRAHVTAETATRTPSPQQQRTPRCSCAQPRRHIELTGGDNRLRSAARAGHPGGCASTTADDALGRGGRRRTRHGGW